ncbi:MAG TPA: Ig-like domain-containing protein [Terriglobales bacterium]|nr:Ig-like domain-containing protein [Terriglobales bacterium]
MARLALIGTMGAVVVAAGLVLAYVLSQSDNDDNAPPVAASSASGQGSDTSGAGSGAAPSSSTAGQGNTASTTTTAAATPPAATEVKPSFDVVRVNPNGDTVVAGRADKNAEVTLLDNGQPIGTTTADPNGQWVLLPNSAMAAGQHSLTLRAQSANGKVSDSDNSVIIIQPAPAKDIAGQPSQVPAGALAIEVPKSGTGATRVLTMPSGAGKPGELAVATVDYDAQGRAVLAGTAKPKAVINVYLDNNLLGQANADQSGNWSFVPQSTVTPGLHQLRIDQTDDGGKVTARVELPFDQAPTSVAATDGKVVVQPGNSLWRLARTTYGSGLRYTVIYQANKEKITNPDLIYPGQVFKLPPGSQDGAAPQQ